jgi:Ras-related protein Rap-1B
VEESYLTTIDIDGRALQVEILDTAGQKEYSALRETFMHTGDGFLLIYSITDDQTLEELRDIKEQISRVHPNKRVIHCNSPTALLLRYRYHYFTPKTAICISTELN